VGSPWTTGDGASVAVGGAVGTVVSVAAGCGRGLGASGGVTVALGASVAGAAGRGVLVGVGVGPEAAGEHELNASPAIKTSNNSGHSMPDLRKVIPFRMIINLQSV
jgi:hypothetical protein